MSLKKVNKSQWLCVGICDKDNARFNAKWLSYVGFDMAQSVLYTGHRKRSTPLWIINLGKILVKFIQN